MREYIPKKRGLLSFDWYVPINLGILILVMLIFFNRFTFGHGLLNGCLPADFYMIDLKDKSVRSGNI
ncbi:signal peptidase I, partial [Shigella flexneri]